MWVWVAVAALAAILAMLCAAIAFVVDMRFFTRWRLEKINPHKRAAKYLAHLDLYHLRPSHKNSQIVGSFCKSGREFAESVNLSLTQREEYFQHHYRGYMAARGIPPPQSCRNGLVILHIQYDWAGEAYSYYGNGRTFSEADVLVRHVHLGLDIPVVGVRLPTIGTWLNLAQEDDCLVISLALDQILKKVPPHVKVVLSGECLGSLRVERWLASHWWPRFRNRCAGCILMSPISSMENTINTKTNMFIHDVFHPSLSVPAWNFLCIISPNLQKVEPQSKRCPPIPALVVVLEDDPLCSLKELKNRFPQDSIIVIPAGSTDQNGRNLTHGRCSRWPPFQGIISAFLKSISPIKSI